MTSVAPTSLRSAALVAAPLAAVAAGVFSDGGYGPHARVFFGAAAIAALALSLILRGRPSPRDPVALVLLALAGLGALSALWTIGPPDRTLQWALVCAGYAAVALAAAAAVRAHGAEVLAGGIAAIAMAAAAVGLIAAALHEPPYAVRIAGVWRPGGPFEYAPALALLQVSALPALLAGMAHRSRALAAVAAGGMALAGGVLALAASRTSLAMALLVGGAALAFPGATVRARRAVVAAALGLCAVAALALAAVSGVVAVVAVTALAAVLWPAARGLATRLGPGPTLQVRPRSAAIALLAVAVLAGALAFGAAAGRGAGPPTDFLHGRAATWSAALDTWGDRPLAGTGADAFLAGSARHQNGATVLFAHDLPLELAAELGIAGLVLCAALYAAAGRSLWRARRAVAGWLLGPAAAAFLVSSLVDWPWHLAGAGAVWALAIGGISHRVRAADSE